MHIRFLPPSTFCLYYIILFFLCFSVQTKAQTQAKVLIIVLDGCRSDALQVVESPHIDCLIEKGYSCFESRTIVPTMSGPGWASMLTGVWYTEHRIQGNLFIGHQLQQYPSFFTVLKTLRPSIRTASISHWAPINEKIIREADYQKSPKSDEKVAHEAISLLKNKNPDVLFVHFDAIDHAGHFFGFHPQVKQYRQAIQEVDMHIGKLLNALQQRKTYANEDWLILLSTDHGGIRKGHGGGTEVERNTFIIADKSAIEVQQVEAINDSIFSGRYLTIDATSTELRMPLDDSLDGSNWELHFLLKIDQWQKGVTFLKTPQFELMTHPVDGCSWILKTQNNSIKLQGDSINDRQWHRIDIGYRRGRLHVFQNERLIGIQHQNIPSDPMQKAINITTNNSNLKWTIAQFKWTKTTASSTSKIYDLTNFKTIQKSHVNTKVSREVIVYKSYRHFPLIIDIVPTLFSHLSIPNNQWPIYLKGKELPFNQ